MKKALQPQRVPQPQMVVAVPSLTEVEYSLLCLKPESGYPTGTKLEVLGGNTNAETLYTLPGHTSKYRRIAADFEEYEHEILLKPLPDYITEIAPKEYPGCFRLIINNADMVEMPEPEEEGERVCKIIQHPSTTEAIEAERMFELAQSIKKLRNRAKKNKDPKQLFLTLENEPSLHNQAI